MPVPPVRRVRISFIGTIHAASWQTSIMGNTTGPGIPLQTDLDNWAITLNGLGAAWKTRWQSLNNSQCVWTGCRVDCFEPGQLAISATTTQLFGAFVTGSGTVESAPSSCLVQTLHTVHPGRTGRGRMYWPMTTSYTVASSPAGLPSSLVTGAATDFAAFLTAINGMGGITSMGGVKVCIQSLKDGLMQEVTAVSTDGRPDRQEHRERRLTFAKASHTV